MRALLSWLRRSAIALVTLVVVVATVWASLPSPGPVSNRLGQAVRVKQANVDVAELTDFPWTEMLVFPAYYGLQATCRTLHLDEPRCSELVDERQADGAQMLAFRDGTQVVHVEHHTWRNGPILFPSGRGARPLVLLREQAQLQAREEYWAAPADRPASAAASR